MGPYAGTSITKWTNFLLKNLVTILIFLYQNYQNYHAVTNGIRTNLQLNI